MGSREIADSETGENEHGKPRWGLGLADLTPELRDQLQAPNDLHGAVVERVQPGSPADNAGLQPGDVIVQRQSSRRAERAPTCSRLCRACPRVRMRWCWSGPTAATLSACCTRRKDRNDIPALVREDKGGVTAVSAVMRERRAGPD